MSWSSEGLPFTSRMNLPTTRPIRSSEPTLAQEPVTLDEAKYQCGVSRDSDYHDQFLNRLIAAAREQVEHDTGLVCYTGTFTWKLTAFPCNSWLQIPGVRPVTAITSIAYIDTAGVTQTWSSSNYTFGTQEVIPTIYLAYLQTWPVVRGDANGITITFTAGYSSVATIPQRVKQACLFLVNHWFSNQDTVSVGTISPDIGLTYDSLINGLMRSSYP